MRIWHEQLPSKYPALENFNHNWVARLPHPSGARTLEIGAGLGEHLLHEDLTDQEYYCLEVRPAFCERIREKIAPERVICSDIQDRVGLPDASFDRVIAIHTLEHLPRLPDAIAEIRRLLKTTGIFDVLIPCEGGLAHSFARRVSAQRLFEKRFKMSFAPITQNEHVNTLPEILEVLQETFVVETSRFFPLRIPIYTINLAAGMRLRPKYDGPRHP
jgi:SAM-dependent methyltransferase